MTRYTINLLLLSGAFCLVAKGVETLRRPEEMGPDLTPQPTDALVERAEPYWRPGRDDDGGPIGFRGRA